MQNKKSVIYILYVFKFYKKKNNKQTVNCDCVNNIAVC